MDTTTDLDNVPWESLGLDPTLTDSVLPKDERPDEGDLVESSFEERLESTFLSRTESAVGGLDADADDFISVGEVGGDEGELVEDFSAEAALFLILSDCFEDDEPIFWDDDLRSDDLSRLLDDFLWVDDSFLLDPDLLLILSLSLDAIFLCLSFDDSRLSLEMSFFTVIFPSLDVSVSPASPLFIFTATVTSSASLLLSTTTSSATTPSTTTSPSTPAGRSLPPP